jgi:hypothetical protein
MYLLRHLQLTFHLFPSYAFQFVTLLALLLLLLSLFVLYLGTPIACTAAPRWGSSRRLLLLYARGGVGCLVAQVPLLLCRLNHIPSASASSADEAVGNGYLRGCLDRLGDGLGLGFEVL